MTSSFESFIDFRTNEYLPRLLVPEISTIPYTDTLVATATVPRYIYKDRYARALYKDFKEQEKSARWGD